MQPPGIDHAATRPAPLWRRLAAICYDLLLVTALLMALTMVVIMIRGGRAIESGSVWFQILLAGSWWLYFAWSWTHGGQTIGMRAWRLSLDAATGSKVGWQQATVRFFAAGLSVAMVGLGFLWALLDPERSTWHDRLSQTRLRYRPKSAQARDGEQSDQQQ